MKTSDNIDELALAFSKAQLELSAVSKDSHSDVGYNYATLDKVIEVIRKPFADNQLSYIQTCGNADEQVTVTTRIIHSSGQYIEDTLSMPVVIPVSNAGKEMMNHAQACGAVITYARRYSLASICGVAQEDSDAHSGESTAKKFNNSSKMSSEKQQKLVHDLMTDNNVPFTDVAKKYNVTRLGELTSMQASQCIESLMKNKSIEVIA